MALSALADSANSIKLRTTSAMCVLGAMAPARFVLAFVLATVEFCRSAAAVVCLCLAAHARNNTKHRRRVPALKVPDSSNEPFKRSVSVAIVWDTHTVPNHRRQAVSKQETACRPYEGPKDK